MIKTIFAPDVLSQAKLGKTVKDALKAKQEEITSLRKDLNAVKREVEKLTRKETQAQKIIDEHTTLQHRCQELEANIERLSQFTENDVTQLRQQLETLKQRLPQHGKEVEQYETQIEQTGEQLLLLTDETLTHLSEKAKNALQRADAREKELHVTVRQIQEAMERYQEIGEQLSERKNVLTLYSNADREIAKMLPNARDVKEVLDEVERMLHGADQALKEAMKANSEARKLSELGY